MGRLEPDSSSPSKRCALASGTGSEGHAEVFREALEGNAHLELLEHIRSGLAVLRPTLDTHLTRARHMLDPAVADANAATAGLAQSEGEQSPVSRGYPRGQPCGGCGS
jgi:hypothetical protein